MIRRALVFAATLMTTSAALAAGDPPGAGFEIGARVGYGFAAGNRGAAPNATPPINDANVGDYVPGQFPLWLDVGYRFDRALYLGGFFQYGIGDVNEDRQAGCRGADVNCSASDVRLGIMGRYSFVVPAPVVPWVGLGVGLEWGTFSVRLPQSPFGSSNVDQTWSGYEFANIQGGLDYRLSPLFALGGFISGSFGQFQSVSTTTTLMTDTGTMSSTTDEDVTDKSLHHWILIGARVSFTP